MKLDLIRPACRADADKVTRLVNRAYRPEIGTSAWTHELGIVTDDRTDIGQLASKIQQAESIVLLGIAGDALVACVHIARHMETSHFGMLAVAPDFQTLGAGTQILAHAEEYAAHHFNAERFAVTVISSRIELVSFYMRRGYQKTGLSMPYLLADGAGTPVQHDLSVETLEKLNIRQINHYLPPVLPV